MNISFEDKRVLVTGAGRGIGRSLVKAFIRGKAAKVVAVSRTKSCLDELVAEEPSVIPIAVDLSDPEATKKALENVGPIDILVNNAGVPYPIGFQEITPEDCDKVFNINLQAAITVSQIIVAGMVGRDQKGSIVNMSGAISTRGDRGYHLTAPSRAALDAITRTMAAELGPYNIRVNVVTPALVNTRWAKGCVENKEIFANYISKIPLGRINDVQDVVNAILFLSSDAARMITGHSLAVDGGKLIKA